MRYKTLSLFLLTYLLTGCNPTIRVEAPSEPIRIEITATIKIVVQKDVEELLNDDDLF